VGLQIIAPKEKEVELLQASWAFENVCSWHNRRPKI
jgi:Asp-tRNA(Asn)/Glu-tRNA(Gln) amidotransferase A subunit family amidase